MVCIEPLTMSSTQLTRALSHCCGRRLVLTNNVHGVTAEPSLTKTVNKGFALTTVNTVNASRKPSILKGCAVVDDC